MGGAVSSGRDNNELIDNLMGGGYIRTRAVERVFRVLDRADYMTPHERDQAYKDLAWRSGALHLSAPCIYSEVMEALELRPGLSFLNLGSGTGYLSTLVGLIIGSGGINHGVEIHSGVVEYCNKKLSQFLDNSVTLDEFDYCVPKYYTGNVLCLAPLQTPYDRVYVGAGVQPKFENYFKQLIKVGGVLVMPLGDTLVQIHRTSETEWTSRQLLNVSFALLRGPTMVDAADPLKMDELTPPPLMVLSRAAIRRAMMGSVCRRLPELREPAARRAPTPRPRPRRICIPLDPENNRLTTLHDLNAQDGGREMNALLSLVLSMGNNRVAGSLRLQDDNRRGRRQEEVEVLIDEIDNGSDVEANRLSTNDSDDDPRPSATGAAVGDVSIDNAELRIVYGGGGPNTGPAYTASLMTESPVNDSSDSDPPSEVDPPATTPAGRLHVQPAGSSERPATPAAPAAPAATPAEATPGQQDGGSESRPSTSGKSPDRAGAASAGAGAGPSTSSSEEPASGSGSGTSSGSAAGNGSAKKRGSGGGDGGRVRRRRRPRGSSSRRRAKQSANRTKRFPPAVQIYFGNSDAAQPDGNAEAATRMDEENSSSDDDPPTGAQDNKRQKLDSGFGEGAGVSTSSVSGGSSASVSSVTSDSSGSGSSSKSARRAKTEDSDARSSGFSTPDNLDIDSISSGSAGIPRGIMMGTDTALEMVPSGRHTRATRATRRAQRRNRDVRRVRLSVVMKRAVKELPLPHALKKYVNLGRCYQF